MKYYLFTFSLLLLFSCDCFATDRQIKKQDPGNNTSETTVKADTSSKKSAKLPVAKQQASLIPPGNTPKSRKDTTDETGEYHGPLSWKPALLY